MLTPAQLSQFYLQACEIELQAFKPGNVSVYAEGHDMTVADFRISAEVSVQPLCNFDMGLGERIFNAVKATREAVGCNTNLGILLLCAPLIEAAYLLKSAQTLRQSLHQVLANTSIHDADWVFKAIVLASPGGLGNAEQQDVNADASVTLTEAMRLAADKDRIALQYLTGYQDIFDLSMPSYYNSMDKWASRNWAAVAVYADLLAKFPDSHIERKYGSVHSKWVAETMLKLSDELAKAECPEQVMPLLYRIDEGFKSKGINPGTAADLTVATVLAVFIEGVIAEIR
ncbi:triphosphoribosyl-dephospho-CoA synthase [Methylosoma difficile]